MTLSKEAMQWNERLEHRDDPDGLNASRGILFALAVSAVFWVPALILIFG